MTRMCRETMMPTWRRRQLAISDLLRHAKIVTDPHTLEHLNAQVAKREAAVEGELLRARRQAAPQGGGLIRSDSPQSDGVLR
jgi:hypothetical protein